MSKYIRTKDGVFESKTTERGKFIRVPTDNAVAQMHGDNWVWVLEKNIIKQADTIEELCDEAVVIYQKNYDKPFAVVCYGNRKPIPTAKTLYPFAIIYGAIWTDKGLQFVAKMNEKGELELL